MKRKRYNVKVKLIFETSMDHEQTSMVKARQDVERVINDYLINGIDIRKIFDKPPHTIYKVKKHNDE